jgi:Arc/MetJ-type ribon-helix-helix transcriptional regulator
MTIHLPADLERFIQAEVHSGHFASEDDAIAEAVRLLLLRKVSAAQGPLTEQELERKLVASGFLASVPSPRDSASSSVWNFDPVTIQGEPLSETVIRERR